MKHERILAVPADHSPRTIVEAQVVAAMFNALNELQAMDIDVMETISTFLANLAVDQTTPHLVLRRLMRMSQDKMVYILRQQRQQP